MSPRRSRAIPALLPVLFAVLAILVPVALAACGGGDGQSGASDPVAARVNGHPVHHSDVEAARAEARLSGGDTGDKSALNEAVGRELVRQEAERLGVKVGAGEVDRRVAALTKSLGGEKALASALSGARMTKAQLRAALQAAALAEAVQQARYPDLTADEADVVRFYRHNLASLFTEAESVHLHAIVVRNDGIAGNAIKRLRQGYTFGQVARQFSIDPESKDNGGDAGWVTVSSLPAALRKVVLALPVGAVSEPTAGPGGVYVMKVTGRHAEQVMPLSQVREAVRKEITRRRQAAALKRWLKTERQRADIVIP